jgi:hypothetical protein
MHLIVMVGDYLYELVRIMSLLKLTEKVWTKSAWEIWRKAYDQLMKTCFFQLLVCLYASAAWKCNSVDYKSCLCVL